MKSSKSTTKAAGFAYPVGAILQTNYPIPPIGRGEQVAIVQQALKDARPDLNRYMVEAQDGQRAYAYESYLDPLIGLL